MRHGFLLINKPVGPTSHDVVAQIRRILHEPKVGHLGTLDPRADGLMVLAVGSKALKVVELFMGADKEYIATMQCGFVSSTYDAEGVIEVQERKKGWLPPEDPSTIQALIHDHFIGKIQQVPPAYSAIHIGGERAYEKAMRGENVVMKPRDAVIHECSIITYEYPTITLRVHCDSGTYIRSLVHDLGQTMRSGAYLSSLQRTRVGEWNLEHAVKPDHVKFSDVIPLKEILKHLPRRELSDADWEELQQGRVIPGSSSDAGLIAWHEDLPVAMLERSNKHQGMLKPRKVL